MLSLANCSRKLTPNGIYVFIGHDHFGRARRRIVGSMLRLFALVARGRFEAHLPRPPFAQFSKQEVMAVLQELQEAGRLAPVVGKTFPFSEARAAVHGMQEGVFAEGSSSSHRGLAAGSEPLDGMWPLPGFSRSPARGEAPAGNRCREALGARAN